MPLSYAHADAAVMSSGDTVGINIRLSESAVMLLLTSTMSSLDITSISQA